MVTKRCVAVRTVCRNTTIHFLLHHAASSYREQADDYLLPIDIYATFEKKKERKKESEPAPQVLPIYTVQNCKYSCRNVHLLCHSLQNTVFDMFFLLTFQPMFLFSDNTSPRCCWQSLPGLLTM